MKDRVTKKATKSLSAGEFPFKKTLIAACVSMVMQPAAWSQEANQVPDSEDQSLDQSLDQSQNQSLEEVTVYGVRSSLRTAAAIKKNADTHVDAISASDINSLPDVSVLEALQRVPGISIERFAASNDPDHFSTEGSGVTLRGLPNTRSEINGRDTFSANSGRGLSFQDISPELLGSVKIFKNQTADMIEGGISGTIDLNTRKPFDAEGRVVSVSAQANYGDLEGETTPSISGLYSNRWIVAAGEVGVLVSYADSDLDFRSDGAQFGVHTQDDQGRYAPINGGIRTTSTNRKRTGASAVIQFNNTDETFSATAEYIRSDSTNDWLEYAFFSDDAGGSPASNAVFNGNIFQGGTIEGVGGGVGPQTRRQNGNTLVEDFSLNLGFQPNDRLSISADFQYVDSSTEVEDFSVFGAIAGGGISIDLQDNGDVPSVVFRARPGSGQSDAEFFSDPNNFFWRGAMDHFEDSEGDEVAARLDFDYALEQDFLTSVQAGLRTSERDQTTRWSNYNWGNLSETWTGNGIATFAGTPSASGFGNNQASAFSFGDFHGGSVGGLPGGTALFANASLVSDAETFAANFDVPGVFRGSLDGRDGAVGPYTPAEINSTNEKNTSAYVRLNFSVDGDRRLDGNVGLRYVNLDTSVKGGQTFPTINLPPEVIARLPAAQQSIVSFANGASSNEDADSSFSKVLPSLNLKYEVSPDLIARFAASQAVAFPDLGNLRYNYNISIDIETNNGAPTFNRFFQSSGNPFLKPMESNNFDASLEYYFGDGGDFVSFGLFHKDMKNFFSNRTEDVLVTNPSNGAQQIVEINQPVNIGEATLNGVEFAYQQFFDQLPGVWKGLGMQFNLTYLDPSSVPQQNLRPDQSGATSDADRASIPFTNLPLQGLSETQFNLVGIFQNDKVEARLAYNWRDDYLLTIREVNIGLPTFAKSRGQLDGSIFYRFNDQWEVGLQGSNLLQDEVVTTSQVDADGTQVFRSSFIFDRRLTFVARATF